MIEMGPYSGTRGGLSLPGNSRCGRGDVVVALCGLFEVTERLESVDPLHSRWPKVSPWFDPLSHSGRGLHQLTAILGSKPVS